MTGTAWSLVFALCLLSTPALAHHSYADYARDQLSEFRGTLTRIRWANPHILLTLSSREGDLLVEWITLDGASRTGIDKNAMTIGDELVVVGSRHRNPQQRVISLVKQLSIPARHWQWIAPAQTRFVPAPGTDHSTP